MEGRWNWHECRAPAFSRALEGAGSVMQLMRPRRYLLGIALYLGAFCAGSPEVRAQAAKPETADVTIGLSVNDSTFLPIYLAETAGFYKDEGLKVKVLAFRGGSDLTRALVAGSVQVAVAAPTSVLAAINAGEKVKVFYGGFNQAPFFWYAAPSIKTMADVKGKRLGITRFGSSTDALTRFALVAAKLDPNKDVRIIQGGGSRLQPDRQPERFHAGFPDPVLLRHAELHRQKSSDPQGRSARFRAGGASGQG